MVTNVKSQWIDFDGNFHQCLCHEMFAMPYVKNNNLQIDTDSITTLINNNWVRLTQFDGLIFAAYNKTNGMNNIQKRSLNNYVIENKLTLFDGWNGRNMDVG